MAGTWLLRAGEIEGYLRHLKEKFQIESNQCGQWARQSTGIYETPSYLCIFFFNSTFDWTGMRRKLKMLEEEGGPFWP